MDSATTEKVFFFEMLMVMYNVHCTSSKYNEIFGHPNGLQDFEFRKAI